MWLFRSPREFPHPYVKRTRATTSTTLTKDGWSKWFTERLEEALKPGNGLWTSSQIQVMGGTNSAFRNNGNGSTAYSWRDATVVGTWDVFYQEDQTKKAAEEWQRENDEGALKHFSKDDRRLLWGSYGEWDMKKVWQHYYEVPTYQKLQQIRKQADPTGVFTSNPFCVEAAK